MSLGLGTLLVAARYRFKRIGGKAEKVRVPLSWSLVAFVLSLAVAPLYGWHVKRDTDKWWVQEIKLKNGRVMDVVNSGSIEIDAADRAALVAIDEAHSRGKVENAQLQTQRQGTQLSEDCLRCRVPASRVRVQSISGR